MRSMSLVKERLQVASRLGALMADPTSPLGGHGYVPVALDDTVGYALAEADRFDSHARIAYEELGEIQIIEVRPEGEGDTPTQDVATTASIAMLSALLRETGREVVRLVDGMVANPPELARLCDTR